MNKVKLFVGICLSLFFVTVVSLFTAAFLSVKSVKTPNGKTVVSQNGIQDNNSVGGANNSNSAPVLSFLTLDEVAKHNNTGDCWLVISNKVYNVTPFLQQHPGGAATIIKYCGQDGTTAFATKDEPRASNHSKMAHDLLAQYYVGDLGQQIAMAPPGTTGVPAGAGKTTTTGNGVLPTLLPTTKPGTTPTVTLTSSGISLSAAEIATHNTLQNCWMIISGNVYDLTSFVFQHPGGVTALANYCGKDGTSGFQTKDKSPSSNHSSYAYSLLNNYLIGSVGATVAVPTPAPTQAPIIIYPTATPVPAAPTSTTAPGQPTPTPVTPTSVPNLTLTAAEVATHNTLQNCWIIISGKVYDVTKYITVHPGGAQAILNMCGKDSTTAFQTKGGTGNNHSNTAYNLLNNYLIGTLGSSVPVNPTATPVPPTAVPGVPTATPRPPTSTPAPGAPTSTPVPAATNAPAATSTPVPACSNMPSVVCTKYPGATRRSGQFDGSQWEGEANTPSNGCRHIKTNNNVISSDVAC